MKKNATELVFILDRSGSMSGLENDTIGGYNSMLEKQKSQEGECRITTVLFDNEYEVLHDRIDMPAVNCITDKDYWVRGSTALLDAIGRTIYKIGNVQKNTTDDFRAEKVLFVIITDGQENASREFTAERVRRLIMNQKKKYNWEFIFLGANIDAVETAAHLGIDRNRAQSYLNDREGVTLNYNVLSHAVCQFRCSEISDDWNEEIEKDMKQRGN
jgi:uncharacterized protein YegL